MVHAPDDLDRAEYRADMSVLLDDLVSRPLGEIRVAAAMNDVFGIARKHGLRFRAEYFLLFRSAMLVDGVLRGLDPAVDPVSATRLAHRAVVVSARVVRNQRSPWRRWRRSTRAAGIARRARLALVRGSKRLLPPANR